MAKTKAMLPIIVSGITSDGRLYGIVYFDADDRKWHMGYTSNRLDIVHEWLRTHFDIVPIPYRLLTKKQTQIDRDEGGDS